MASENYERYGVWVKKTADVDDPYSLNGGKSLPILKDILSEISILRQDILQLKEEISAFHRDGAQMPVTATEVALDSEPLTESPPEINLEPVTDEALLSEPEAPVLDNEAPLEISEPVIEQTASMGGFLDEDSDDASLILSDSELMNILNSAEVSAEEPEEMTSTELPSTESISTEILDVAEETPQASAVMFEDADFTVDTPPEESPELELPPLDEVPADVPLEEYLSHEDLGELPPLAEASLEEPGDVPDDVPVEEPAESISTEVLDETPEEAHEEVFEDFDLVDDKLPNKAVEPLAEPTEEIPPTLTQDIKSVLTYLDNLLENLPEEKIVEFAQSDKYETYKKIFFELGLA